VTQLRPLQADDVEGAYGTNIAAFGDLDRRHGRPPSPKPPLEAFALRAEHLRTTDPDGAWVAERDGRIVGVALALLREGIWGLSLLALHPDEQGRGTGRALLERTLAYGDGARGGIILASDDSRAIGLYARAGFRLLPAIEADGVPRRRPSWPDEVREGSAGDLPATIGIDQAIRGAARPQDLGAFLATGRRLLLVDGRGYAVVDPGSTTRISTLAALDEDAAAALARAAFALAEQEAAIWFITAGQDWAVRAALDAGLQLRPAGPVLVRGEVGPLRPYIPSGAYL
jgi:GNAT superfamily N-acetyltransferase